VTVETGLYLLGLGMGYASRVHGGWSPGQTDLGKKLHQPDTQPPTPRTTFRTGGIDSQEDCGSSTTTR